MIRLFSLFLGAWLFASPVWAGVTAGVNALQRGNYVLALKHLVPEAQSGLAEAQYHLAYMYNHGLGVDYNPSFATNLYARAAAQGHLNANFELGRMIYAGSGIAQDYRKSYNIFASAAQQGHLEALYFWAFMTLNGQGTPSNLKWGVSLVQQAAARNHPGALNYMGILHMQGQGLPRNLVRATQYFQKSADRGNPEAMLNLANAYATGEGAEKDPKQAFLWASLAVAYGQKDIQIPAGRLKRALTTQLPPATIALLENNASAWQPITDAR